MTEEEQIQTLRHELQEWENLFYPFDEGNDFPGRISVDYTDEPRIRRRLIRARKVLNEISATKQRSTTTYVR